MAGEDPVLMAAWKRDRRISYPWQAKGGTAPPAPAPETTTTTPQPTVTRRREVDSFEG
jgi:hypothetical protein